MMVATAWMYAVMNASVLGLSADHSLSGWLAMNISGMEMPAQWMPGNAPGPQRIAGVNWIATLGFAVVALYWSCRFFAERRISPVRSLKRLARIEVLYQLFGAVGTALMFGLLL